MHRKMSLPLVAAAAALIVFTGTAVAGSGVGAVFNLGQTNTVNAQTVLTGNAGTSPQLRVQNNGTGPALSLVSGSSSVPLIKLSNSAKIGSLNSDLLDGYDSNAIPFYWKLGGNATNSTGVLGTTTNQALELKAGGGRALRLEPGGLAPNLVGGWGGNGNSANNGAYGITIAGGGGPMSENRVTDNYGTIGGGFSNVAGNLDADAGNAEQATVAGGAGNKAQALSATVSGGDNNTAEGQRSTIAGGTQNHTTGLQSFIGGGGGNTASALNAFVAGGDTNTASGKWSFAAGRRAKADDDGSFVWGDSTDADVSSPVANSFTVRASGGMYINGPAKVSLGALSTAVDTFADGATTPSVAAGNVFITNNTLPTAITNFTSAYAGQTITIVFQDGATTVKDNGNIHLHGSADYAPSQTDTLTLVNTNGMEWFEVSHSSNF